MLYCFRERELLLNINELLAGFRLFPSYMRIGGLREDLPSGFHETVKAFLDRYLFQSIAGSPEELMSFVKSEEPKWRKIIQDAKIKVE